MSSTRIATENDLAAVLALTRANRSLLAQLEPDFWRKATNADQLHELFISSQLGNSDFVKRVLEIDDRVVGYAVSVRHPADFFFIDDVCLDVAEADWATDGTELLNSIEERPALMTAPHRDAERTRAALAAGLDLAGSAWSFRFDQTLPPALRDEPIVAIVRPDPLAAPPRHVWLPAMAADSVSCVGDGRDGYAVISPAIAPPPIYDPGGRPSVVDRVIGDNRADALRAALDFARQRRDIGVILVVEQHDAELLGIAEGFSARRVVDVFEWPG